MLWNLESTCLKTLPFHLVPLAKLRTIIYWWPLIYCISFVMRSKFNILKVHFGMDILLTLMINWQTGSIFVFIFMCSLLPVFSYIHILYTLFYLFQALPNIYYMGLVHLETRTKKGFRGQPLMIWGTGRRKSRSYTVCLWLFLWWLAIPIQVFQFLFSKMMCF